VRYEVSNTKAAKAAFVSFPRRRESIFSYFFNKVRQKSRANKNSGMVLEIVYELENSSLLRLKQLDF